MGFLFFLDYGVITTTLPEYFGSAWIAARVVEGHVICTVAAVGGLTVPCTWLPVMAG
jgi:hypothetical protein